MATIVHNCVAIFMNGTSTMLQSLAYYGKINFGDMDNNYYGKINFGDICNYCFRVRGFISF